MGKYTVARRAISSAGRFFGGRGGGGGFGAGGGRGGAFKSMGEVGKAVADAIDSLTSLYDAVMDTINAVRSSPGDKDDAKQAAQGLYELSSTAYDYAMSSVANEGQATIVENIGPQAWMAIAWNGHNEAGDDITKAPHFELVDGIAAELQDAGQGYRDTIDKFIGA